MAKEYRNYVFSGSGGMFAAQLGAYKALEELYNPKAFCGTSGGAIVAAMLSQGLSSDRVISKIKNIEISKHIDKYYFSFISMMDKDKLGIIRGQKIYELFKQIVPEKFKDLQYPLTIVTTDINKREPFIFSTENTPDVYLYDALRATISLPGIFSPFNYENKLLIDGGLTENFYLDNFKNSNTSTIGIKVNDNNDLDKISSLTDLLLQSLYTSIIRNEKKNIDNIDKKAKIIKLIVDLNIFNFNALNKTKIDEMITQGYSQTKLQLKE